MKSRALPDQVRSRERRHQRVLDAENRTHAIVPLAKPTPAIRRPPIRITVPPVM